MLRAGAARASLGPALARSRPPGAAVHEAPTGGCASAQVLHMLRYATLCYATQVLPVLAVEGTDDAIATARSICERPLALCIA
jgi:hypothetical protein